MANQYTTMSEQAIKYLCGLIREVVSVSDSIDDIHLRTDGTFSSVKIDNLIKQCLADGKDYADEVCAALVKLTCKKTTTLPTLDNSEINVIYLYSADGNAPFEQYLRISETELIDMGSTTINLTDYYDKATADGKFALKTDLQDVVDKIGSTTLPTTDKTLTGAIAETYEKANASKTIALTKEQYDTIYAGGDVTIDGETITYDDKAFYIITDDTDSVSITKTISSSSTDSEVPTALAVESRIKDDGFAIRLFSNFSYPILGITYDNTITEVVRAIGTWVKNNYYTEKEFSVDIYTNKATTVFAQSLPAKDIATVCNIRFMPYCQTSRVQILLTDTVGGESWLGSLKNSETDDIVWKRVCTTTVDDVADTTVSTNDVFTSTNDILYSVLNGMCTLKFEASGLSYTTDINHSWVKVTDDILPRSKMGVKFPLVCMPSGKAIVCTMDTNNENLKVYGIIPSGTTGIYGSISYPVAE